MTKPCRSSSASQLAPMGLIKEIRHTTKAFPVPSFPTVSLLVPTVTGSSYWLPGGHVPSRPISSCSRTDKLDINRLPLPRQSVDPNSSTSFEGDQGAPLRYEGVDVCRVRER
jgi:hypothetical protein